MPTNKRIIDLSDYTSVLPYASELFGVYQPLIGWKSKRVLKRMNKGMITGPSSRLAALAGRYQGIISARFDACTINRDNYQPGVERRFTLRPQTDSVLLSSISKLLGEAEKVPDADGWRKLINADSLKRILNEDVFSFHAGAFRERCMQYAQLHRGRQDPALQSEVVDVLKTESAIAGALIGYVEHALFDKLEALFYFARTPNEDVMAAVREGDYNDPYLSFDPKKDIKDVSLSPVGVVHLYRQYFFELDTFLGTPVSHVWLSPGSSVELIEVSTRKTITEKTIETSLETTTKTERSTTSQEEISEAVKQDNKDDMKLGFSTTVNQSWGTGNATATGSLNLDKTQQVAREQTQKRSRQQTEKLSTEIRQNFKTSFRTVTENTDTTSKRYLLNNATNELINYELRRKMRQVGVQIQDIGSYLCWESFVDEPGMQLGLPDLVHIATPADLVLVPNPKLIPMPPQTIQVGFTGEMEWFFPENQRQWNGPDGFHRLNTIGIPSIPDGYEVQNKGVVIDIAQEVVVMEDDDSEFFKGITARGKLTNDGLYVDVGLVLGGGGLAWDEGRIRFKVSGSIDCKLNDAKMSEIATANDALISAKLVADNENQRKQEEAFRKTASDRIALASKITKRKFEDLREEERTIVYRNLIKSLMTEQHYKNLPDTQTGFETRHVLSELINSIFDIDKMLYFVAPEWWKPRKRSRLNIGDAAIADSINGSLVNWSDKQQRSDNYFITEKSDPAPLGSSLGWMLQLDGDDLRNAFLNAPWVKAVIPIRPGKEKAAIAWLQNVNVEGSDGLDAIYSAPDDELVRINVYLGSGKVPRQFTDAEWAAISADTAPAPVTIRQALEFLCAEVSYKEDVSKTVSRYPKEEINDDNKVLATPIEKVYEHGFYPLKGGFKAVVEDYFETISQWIEVLPTDQVVPVEVKYDPKTGRQL
ncbi:hypothetical protein [Cupriavidus pauculus]|uniref:hypothetical protein n=1 Tax=Cupriavidus pauculus TaxID=82633 RepID=UPI001EE33E5F|nr:hypothetical protein [Cupriavidus pauculus]GJG97616.1 hypothetical protein CBA19C6_24025 [Cupriavidus pauculus]